MRELERATREIQDHRNSTQDIKTVSTESHRLKTQRETVRHRLGKKRERERFIMTVCLLLMESPIRVFCRKRWPKRMIEKADRMMEIEEEREREREKRERETDVHHRHIFEASWADISSII